MQPAGAIRDKGNAIADGDAIRCARQRVAGQELPGLGGIGGIHHIDDMGSIDTAGVADDYAQPGAVEGDGRACDVVGITAFDQFWRFWIADIDSNVATVKSIRSIDIGHAIGDGELATAIGQ